MFFIPFKAPGGWLGILGVHREARSVWGIVAYAWLHTVKHTKSLNFYVNLSVFRWVLWV